MCKFESVHAPGYLTISTSIREWVADSPNVIPTRWAVEEEGRRQRASLEVSERIRKYHVSLYRSRLGREPCADLLVAGN